MGAMGNVTVAGSVDVSMLQMPDLNSLQDTEYSI